MRKYIILFFLFFFVCSQCLFGKDIEFILYKDFLQKLIEKIFPINLSEGYISEIKINESVPLGYKIDINSPVLTIQPKYIEIDAQTSVVSVFGNKSFPVKCRFLPIYNPADNNIELKVVEGKVDLNLDENINLGVVDLTPYLSGIKIPLKIDSIDVRDKNIKPRCRNVAFKLLPDRVIVDSEVAVE